MFKIVKILIFCCFGMLFAADVCVDKALLSSDVEQNLLQQPNDAVLKDRAGVSKKDKNKRKGLSRLQKTVLGTGAIGAVLGGAYLLATLSKRFVGPSDDEPILQNAWKHSDVSIQYSIYDVPILHNVWKHFFEGGWIYCNAPKRNCPFLINQDYERPAGREMPDNLMKYSHQIGFRYLNTQNLSLGCCVAFAADSNVNERTRESVLEKISKKDSHIQLTKQMQQDAISWMASTYEIHLQINEKHLERFFNVLLSAIIQNKILFDNIYQIKRQDFLTAEQFQTFRSTSMPSMVVYVTNSYLPTMQLRNEILGHTLHELIKLVNWYLQSNNLTIDDIKLDYTPRFNHKVTDLVYIAGGDADYKTIFLEAFLHKISIFNHAVYSPATFSPFPNSVYTDDFCFLKGFEFRAGPDGFVH